MAKILSLLVASIAAFAVSVPAIASAAPLTEGGAAVSIGKLIEATSVDMIVETSLGKAGCGLVTITSEVTVNSSATYKGVGKGTSTGTTCFLGGTKQITFTNFKLNEIHNGTVGQGTTNITFEADLPNKVTCHFESPNVPFTYVSGTDTISVNKGDLKATPAACEPGLLTGNFTIETDGTSTPVILD